MKLYNQRTKTLTKRITYDGVRCNMTVKLRYDDHCRSRHNSFAITGCVDKVGAGDRDAAVMFGCIHDEIAKYFPALKPLIQWHLFDDNGPMHYVANTLHHLGYTSGPDSYWYKEERDQPNIEHARSTAVWSDMPESFICGRDERMLKVTRDAAAVPIRAALEKRLPALVERFRVAMSEIEWDVAEVRS